MTYDPAALFGALAEHPLGHVRVCSLDRLLDMKRAAGRPQDIQDVAMLEL